MEKINLNQNAADIAKRMITKKRELKIGNLRLKNGASIIDCGVEYEGSLDAGSMFALACMGGLAEVNIGKENFGNFFLPKVEVKTNAPAIACLASQKAGWKIKGEGFSAIGSGPARILSKKPKETFEKLGYSENSDKAVVALECSRYPSEEVCADIAKACGVAPDKLYVLVARTASLAGSVQISARAIETCLYRIEHLGYDVKSILSASGSAPVAPVIGDDAKMMGITNDMIIYGSRVFLEANGRVDVEKIPSKNSPAYGKSFAEIFKEAGYDFYKIDPSIFAPAEVTARNKNTHGEISAGKVNEYILRKSLGL